MAILHKCKDSFIEYETKPYVGLMINFVLNRDHRKFFFFTCY